MKIRELNLAKIPATKNLGINPKHLKRLGQMIALVGKNGSGKSRILKLIEEYILQEITIEDIFSNKVYLKNLHDKFQSQPEIIIEYLINNQKRIALHNSSKDYKKTAEYKSLLDELNESINKQIAIIGAKNFSEINVLFSQYTQSLKTLSKNNLRIIDSEKLRSIKKSFDNNSKGGFEDIIENVTSSQTFDEFNMISESALHYLQKLPHKLAADYHDCFGDETKFKRRKSYNRYSLIKSLVKKFLGKEFIWESLKSKVKEGTDGASIHVKGIWKIENREFNYTEFSNGEKILFSYCMLFFLLDQNKNSQLKNCIIIIDEPELNLHPESQINLIQGLRDIIKETGQIWIATHSISLISNLKYEEIYIVKSNTIYPPSRNNPTETVNQLMGIQEHIYNLATFMSSSKDWAYINFMSQCLLDPQVIDTANKNDPQLEVFLTSINRGNSTVLDFGAGTGRMYKALIELDAFNVKINEYHALEIKAESRDSLKKLGIKNVYPDSSKLPENIFDYVLICNVLHEVPVSNWITTLNRLVKSLKPTGHIVLIEVNELPVGEKIDEAGFLVLDPPSVKSLFGLDIDPIQIFSSNQRYVDKIMCIPIRKNNIKKLNRKRLCDSLKILNRNTYERIKTIRKKAKSDDFAMGRQIGFYSQLYINSKIAIELME